MARSTAYQWTKHIALVQDTAEAERRKAHAKVMTDARWARHRLRREQRQAEIARDAVAQVGAVGDRDLLLLGAAIYWCEGTKSKPWRSGEMIQFVNSDVRLIRLFLRFLGIAGHTAEDIAFRVAIHETGDREAAERWWAEQVGVPVETLLKMSLKRHVPRRTGRPDRGGAYHGCLIVTVRKSRETYWLVEAIVNALGQT